MRHFKQILITSLAMSMLTIGPADGEEKMDQPGKDRSAVSQAHKWKLDDLYASRAAWEKDLAGLDMQLAGVKKCRGQMGRGIKRLAGCLDQMFELQKRLYRLYSYAMRNNDQDARATAGQEMKSQMQKKATDVNAALSFVEPEILKIPPRRLGAFLKSKRLAIYHHYIDNITRRRAHILQPGEEKIIARAGDMSAVPTNVYEIFSTVNMPRPEVTLKSGKKVTLTAAMYTRYRAADDRDDRLAVFKAFWGAYKKFRESFATLLAGEVSRDHFYALVRKYKNDMSSALDSNNVPTSIYTNMIKQIRAARPLLWRYLKIRKKMLKIQDLGYHDLYASIVPAMEMHTTFDQAKKTIIEALAPLGKEYTDILTGALDQRWADIYPTKGKRSGAYSDGSAYDVHPYVLLNYNDDYDSLSTTAHEFGHAMHSYLSNKNQPFALADYPIFVAEVASTTNENLLRLDLYSKEKDRDKKLFLLGQHLENFRTTVFRQALFAEFEMTIHDLAQKSVPLTADKLDEIYLKLLREYYGESEGEMKTDPLYAVEWAYIPHFYYNFYMFQYTTSFIAATAIAEKVYAGDTKTRDNYLKMLKSGCSKYAVELLKMAGVDMTNPTPYKVAFKSMERSLDEIDKLIAE
ncbi:MAG TPA: oligoendopeptidase F [Myxococcota bacterium]|nr:oligoendopeptidase F [Myxococcota bacterium]